MLIFRVDMGVGVDMVVVGVGVGVGVDMVGVGGGVGVDMGVGGGWRSVTKAPVTDAAARL